MHHLLHHKLQQLLQQQGVGTARPFHLHQHQPCSNLWTHRKHGRSSKHYSRSQNSACHTVACSQCSSPAPEARAVCNSAACNGATFPLAPAPQGFMVQGFSLLRAAQKWFEAKKRPAAAHVQQRQQEPESMEFGDGSEDSRS